MAHWLTKVVKFDIILYYALIFQKNVKFLIFDEYQEVILSGGKIFN